jgi:putative addiction module killer protein
LEVTPRKILRCHADDGSVPFDDWLKGLDGNVRNRVRARIDRVEDGNLGDVRPVGEGVSELRMDFGPGYRVYFGQKAKEIYLIIGGTKDTQDADIKAAKAFWRTHA